MSKVLTHEDMDGGPYEQRIGKITTQLHDFVDKATCAAMMTARNRADGMVIALGAVQAGMHLLAHAIASEDHEALTSTQVLFAALLAYQTSPYEVERGKAYSEYSPVVVNEALIQFEKLTGRQPDEELNEQMCRVCREFVTDPKNVALLASKRRAAMGMEGHTLN